MQKTTTTPLMCGQILIAMSLAFAAILGCSEHDTTTVAPDQTETATNDSIEIPFTLTKWNNISIDVTVNDAEDLKLMFHTAAGSVVVTEEAAKTCPSLKFDEEVTAKSWGGESNMGFCKNNRLQIQQLAWDNVTIFRDLHSGHETDGKFGPGQFDGKFVEIDYERGALVIHDNLPEKTAQFEKFTFEKDRDSYFITGTINIDEQLVSNKFMIHSGYSGVAMLDDLFVADNQNLKNLPVIDESEVKDSFGNVLKTKKIKLPSMQFGTMKFTDVPVSIFEGSIGRQKVSILGGDMLKRFDIILDARNQTIYLRKNSLQNQEYFVRKKKLET